MRLNTGRSSNVEDRRGRGGMAMGGGIGAVVLALVAMFLGVNPSDVGVGGGAAPADQAPAGAPPADDPAADTVSRVLRSTEQSWEQIFQGMGRQYHAPGLVLFSGSDQSGCGSAQSAMGPFYCPRDRKVYIDLSFYRELHERFGARGQFAEAYVIAHEVGHHVQNELGISQQVQEAERAAGSRAEANGYSVRLELQADCLAGVWANHANQAGTLGLDPGDVESALSAASAIGDDRLQKEAQGHVVPDSFTHGSSEQRVRWFQRGLQGGDLRQCDTFQAASL
ncbi:MAG TPA: neutral zinc metallopeptidase [Longimicrobium sp.]|nr:neutral zinc metallopeptidase [Longimicrobium sp.]